MHRLVPAVRVVAAALVLLGLAASLNADGTRSAFGGATVNAGNVISTESMDPPTGLSGSVRPDGRTVRLAWTPTTSTSATGYRIYRSATAGGPYTLVDTVAGATTATDDDNPPDGTWRYVVRAHAGTWESASSNEVGPLTTATLDHFSIDAIGDRHSGRSFTVTIRARTASNAIVTGWSETATLSTNNGSITPTTTGAFSGGVRTETVTITGGYSAAQTITATGGTPAKTGTSAAFTLHDWVFGFKTTTPASGTGCLGAGLRFRDMAEGFTGGATEETYMRTAGEGRAEFCSPAITTPLTLPAGTTNVRAFMSSTAGSVCDVTATLWKGTTQIGSPVTLAIGNGPKTERVFAVATPAITVASGDRLAVYITWEPVKACNTTYLHYGTSASLSRVQFTG